MTPGSSILASRIKPAVDRATADTPSPIITRRATRSGLPVLRHYFSDAFRYRAFAYHWSVADIKARNFETFLGRFWHYLNPILFGLIYFIFIGIVSRGGLDDTERLALIVGNLYIWVFFSSVIMTGATSVSSGTAGITAQSSIPRVILPLASTLTAANLFARSMLAYVPFHLLAGRTLYVEMLWIPLLVALIGLFGFGLSLLFAVLNVYIRDVSRLLPHVTRLWMYLSPVVWAYPVVFGEPLETLARMNPMYSSITAWTIALGGPLANQPSISSQVAVFAVWAAIVTAVGFLIFVSREDEFAVRS